MTTQTQETTPDQLLESFRGRSFKSILVFTLIVHVVLIGGTSVPYMIKSIAGKAAANLSEQERTELAATEVTAAMREIATKHGIKPQDLSSRIAGGASPAAPKEVEPAPAKEPVAPETATPEVTPEPEKPKSAIEEQLEVKEEGPKVPTIPVEEATEEDLFGK